MMMKTKELNALLLTRTPTPPPSTSGARFVAFASPGAVSEAKQRHRCGTTRISRGYREGNIAPQRAPLLPRRRRRSRAAFVRGVSRRVALPRFEGFLFFDESDDEEKKTRAATRSHRPTGKGQSSFSLPHSLDAIHHASVDGLGLLWRLPPQLAGRAQLEEDVHRVRREEKRIDSVRSNRDHRFSVEKRVLFSTSCFLR